MKKFIIICFAILASVCGCDFDPKIYGVLSTTNFPKTESDYDQYLLQCYIPFASISWGYYLSSIYQQPFYNENGGTVRMLDATTDISAPCIINSMAGSWLKLTSGQFDDMKYYGANGGDDPSHIEKIREVTRFTEVIGALENAEISTESKNYFLGEAHLLRGMVMYYLLHYYGPVPVLLNPEDVGNKEVEARLVRPTLDEMVLYITNDLEFAVANMRENQEQTGRYNADYARFCLMRHYLNEGAHIDGYYSKAYELFSEFTGSYSLFDSGQNPYAEQFKSANNFNKEVVMAIACSTDHTNGNSNGISFYSIPNDAAAVDDQGQPTPFYLHQGPWGHCYNIDPLFYDTFEEKDLRRETILTSYYSRNGYWVTRDDLGVLWSGFIANKFPIESYTFSQPSAIPLARWADVLLLFAEASVRKNNAVLPEAIRAVNQVRKRAGLEDLPEAKTSSVDAFMDALLMERGHELFFEGCRKIDLIRFNKYYTVMKDAGRAPTSQYFPIPDYLIRKAKDAGYNLTQYFTRDDYDGPKR